ncbi:hypothetical protein VTJ49DRAFT_5782 [Mycothermus thermophilus]|uniref:Uncharacterized protein n=1 Tax=Humicola insolens TaxID=85995 RepID=A0ABR3VR52_HUMIN
MAATPIRLSFSGFLATTFDAVLVLEAALNNRIHIHQRPLTQEELEPLVHSGAIFVCGVGGDAGDITDWKDGRRWSPPSAQCVQGNPTGFNLYRELLEPGMQRPTEELNYEQDHAESLAPFLGAHVANEMAKPFGLMKKTINFTISGEEYAVISYYTIADVLCGMLPRPRHRYDWDDFAVPPRQEFWEPEAQALIITNDNAEAAAPDTRGWMVVGLVPPPRFASTEAEDADGEEDSTSDEEAEEL